MPARYGWNTESVFNPVGNLLGLDPRLTGVLPNAQNGFFGPAGNGGNLGEAAPQGIVVLITVTPVHIAGSDLNRLGLGSESDPT